MLALSTRTALLVALAAPVAVVAASCAQISGIDQYIDCPQDPACPTCTDGKKNGDESDVDCGGDCPSKCATGQACSKGADCTHGVCTSGKCEAPPAATCDDGLKNQDESDIDCGGVRCKKCTETQGCNSGADCESQVCGGGSCSAASCTDGKKNGGESDVDCGGTSCEKCKPGEGCGGDGDCLGGACDTATMTCAASCTDKVKNGGESDVDCGGTSCPKCGEAKGCGVGGDCETGVCQANKCVTYFGWDAVYGDQNNQTPGGLAVDTSGSVVLAGAMQGTVNFGGAALTSAGVNDAFVVKLDAAGQHQWSKRFGDASAQAATSVATDAAQNVLVTGSFVGGINFGGTALDSGGFPAGCHCGTAMFLAKLDTNGAHLWSKAFVSGLGSLTLSLASQGIATDESTPSVGGGQLFVAGGFGGSVSFGGSMLTSAGGTDVFVASFDKSGTHRWSARYGDASTQFATSIAYDAGDEAVVVGGLFSGTLAFGAPTAPLMQQSAKADTFVAKLSAAGGTPIWSKSFATNDHYVTAPGNGVSIAIDKAGNVYLAGHQSAPTNFGGGPVDGQTYLVKLDASGNHLWSKPFATGETTVHGTLVKIALDNGGNVVLANEFLQTADLGGSSLASPGRALYVAKFDPAGNHLWSRAFGDGGGSVATGLGTYGASAAYVSGWFGGQLDFGGPPALTSLGQDIFVAKLSLP